MLGGDTAVWIKMNFHLSVAMYLANVKLMALDPCDTFLHTSHWISKPNKTYCEQKVNGKEAYFITKKNVV